LAPNWAILKVLFLSLFVAFHELIHVSLSKLWVIKVNISKFLKNNLKIPKILQNNKKIKIFGK